MLVSHAATEAIRLSRFPDDESLNEVGRRDCAKFLPLMADRVLCGPERRTVETAEALSADAKPDEGLRDLDIGRWRGSTLDEIAPLELDAWLTDPTAAPHGGESIVDLVTRVREWQDYLTIGRDSVLAVTHPAVIRAMIMIALDAPPQAFWRIDIPPLGETRLHHRVSWTLRSTR